MCITLPFKCNVSVTVQFFSKSANKNDKNWFFFMGTRLDYGNGRIKSSSSLFSQKKNTKKKNKYGLEQVFPESELERKWTSGYS